MFFVLCFAVVVQQWERTHSSNELVADIGISENNDNDAISNSLDTNGFRYRRAHGSIQKTSLQQSAEGVRLDAETNHIIRTGPIGIDADIFSNFVAQAEQQVAMMLYEYTGNEPPMNGQYYLSPVLLSHLSLQEQAAYQQMEQSQRIIRQLQPDKAYYLYVYPFEDDADHSLFITEDSTLELYENCGDGIIRGAEECDQGELIADVALQDGDGCSIACHLEDGFICEGSPSVCSEDTDICQDAADCEAGMICTQGICVPLEQEQVCGNGICEGGESASPCEPTTENPHLCDGHILCVEDCAAGGPVCGNGACEGELEEASCPQDCAEDLEGECNAMENCENKDCGDDGCGGSCGECEEGKTCEEGKCEDNDLPLVHMPELISVGESECWDPDGYNTYMATTCYDKEQLDPNDPTVRPKDECANQSYLYERICDPGVGVCTTIGVQCPNGCSNGKCNSPRGNECIDTDGGMNFYAKGEVSYENQEFSDKCWTDNALQEFFCDEYIGGIGFKMHPCEYGCRDDACESEEASCSEDCVNCAQNGEKVYGNSAFGPTECCSQNAGIKPTSFISGEVCVTSNDGSQGTCVEDWWVTCGDGLCILPEEDQCNCPQDCAEL